MLQINKLVKTNNAHIVALSNIGTCVEIKWNLSGHTIITLCLHTNYAAGCMQKFTSVWIIVTWSVQLHQQQQPTSTNGIEYLYV